MRGERASGGGVGVWMRHYGGWLWGAGFVVSAAIFVAGIWEGGPLRSSWRVAGFVLGMYGMMGCGWKLGGWLSNWLWERGPEGEFDRELDEYLAGKFPKRPE